MNMKFFYSSVHTMCYIFVLLPTVLFQLGVGQEDVGIRLCRMRNCSVVEDLRGISEAKNGGTSFSLLSGGAVFNSVYSHGRQQMRVLGWSNGYNPFYNAGFTIIDKPHKPTPTVVIIHEEKKQERKESIFPQDQSSAWKQQSPPLNWGIINTSPPWVSLPPPPPNPPAPLPPLAPAEFKKVSQDSNVELSESECVESVVARASATRQLSILSQALAITGLDSVLAEQTFTGTILAPTNDAWERLSEGSGQSLDIIFQNVEMLKSILGLHILAGESRFLQDFYDGQVLDTIVEDEQLQVQISGNNVRIVPSQEISAANILVPDVPACGAVIHVLDGVLLANAGNCVGCRKLSQISLNLELMEQDQQQCYVEEYQTCCEEYYVYDSYLKICDIADSFGLQCQHLKHINDLEEVSVGDVIQIC